MKKVLSALVLTSFLAVLLVPVMASAADCPNSCVTPAAACTCGGYTVTASDPKYCLDGVRYNFDNEGQARCVAAIGGGTTGGAGNEPQPWPTTGIQSMQDIINLIDKIGRWVFTALLAVAAIFLVIAGFMWVTAGGNPEQTTKARQMLINALIGMAIALAAQGLITIIKNFLA